MYTIKATINGTSYVLHDPRFESEGRVVISPVMSREVNRQGSLYFRLAQTHPLYDMITIRTTFVTVYDNNDECWRGRVMSTDRGWNNVKTVYCEGELAYLNDSIVRPLVWHGTRKALFNRLIGRHNGMVDSTRKFAVDLTKTNLDDTITITLTTDSVLSTWEVLKEYILDYGYIMTERVNGETRIYCVTDFTEEAAQTVEFGKNLLDLSESADATNVITYLIPYGDFLEEGQPGYHAEAPTTDGEWNGNRLTIKLANNGSDIIGNALAESIWGKIVGTAVFDNIKAVGTTDDEIRPYAQRLLNAANGELTRRIAESITLEVKAVDLSMINPELDSFGVGKYITAISTLHGIHIRLLCRREEIYLTEPHMTTYTLGAGFKTLTDLQTTDAGTVAPGTHLEKVIEHGSGGGGSVTPASIVTATGAMTAEQKAQTRENIGAGEPLTPQQIADGAGAWLEDNLATPSTPPIDSTLSVANAAADAKVTGDKIDSLKSDFEDVSTIALSNSDRITNTVNTVIGEKQGVNSYSYTFKDNIGNNKLSNMKLLVSGTQSGSGVPSTDNVRPLSQPSSVSVYNTDGTSENTDTVDLSQIASEVYSGYLYPFEGKYVCTVKKIKLDGTNLSISSVNSSRGFCVFNEELDLPIEIYTGSNYVLLCDKLQSISTKAEWDDYSQFVSVAYGNNKAQLVLKPGVPISSKEDVNLWLSTNKPEIAYTIVTPLEYPVNSIEVSTYYGLNTVSVSNGSIVDIQAFNSDIIIGCDQFLQNGIFDYMAFANMADIGKTYSSHGIDFTINNDGSITVDGTSTDTAFQGLVRHKVTKNKLLYIDLHGSSIPLQIYVNDKSNNTITSAIFDRNRQFGIPDNDSVDNIHIRIRVPEGMEINDETVKYSVMNVPIENQLNILVFGNSFSYSTLSYVPSLLAEIAPTLNVNFGILYSSGMQFAGHISKFNQDTAYEQYCEYRSCNQRWTKTNSTVTAKDALDRARWDCIVLQQSVEHLDDFGNLEAFADLLNGHLKYPVKYLYNMGQARGATDDRWLPSHYTGDTMADRSDKHFSDIADYAERALHGCIISEVIPSATAVQNARTTTLAQYGGHGSMCRDALSHLQNGIGILIAGYAASYKILEVTGNYGTIYGIQLNPTDSWITDTNPPSSVHGPCVGVTAANKLLGMKCAMMAIKKPFELTDCSNI